MEEDITFVYQCYKQDFALLRCLEKVRRAYPRAKIILMNDNGNNYQEIALYFGCEYILCPENNDVHFDIPNLTKEQVYERYSLYLKRMQEVLSHSNTTYFMRLEDDIKVRGPIKMIPKRDMIGSINVYGNFNSITNHHIEIMRGRISNGKRYPFLCGGGSLIRIQAFLEYSQQFLSSRVLFDMMYNLNPGNFLTVDIADGLGFLFLGYNLSRSAEIYDMTEEGEGYKNKNYMFIIQYKKYYNREMDISNFRNYLKYQN